MGTQRRVRSTAAASCCCCCSRLQKEGAPTHVAREAPSCTQLSLRNGRPGVQQGQANRHVVREELHGQGPRLDAVGQAQAQSVGAAGAGRGRFAPGASGAA